MARLITPIIDSAGLHRGSFRAGDFSQVLDSADSRKRRGVAERELRDGEGAAFWKVRAVLLG